MQKKKSATKVYVRKKVVLPSKSKECSLQGAEADTGPVTNIDNMVTTNGELLERQCKLVKELGLNYGDDDMKLNESMLDMDNRDNRMAAKMGIHKQKI